MIDQDLINIAGTYIANEQDLPVRLSEELLDSYKSLIEQNAELHKELAKLKSERVFVVNEWKPYDHSSPNDLAM